MAAFQLHSAGFSKQTAPWDFSPQHHNGWGSCKPLILLYQSVVRFYVCHALLVWNNRVVWQRCCECWGKIIIKKSRLPSGILENYMFIPQPNCLRTVWLSSQLSYLKKVRQLWLGCTPGMSAHHRADTEKMNSVFSVWKWKRFMESAQNERESDARTSQWG